MKNVLQKVKIETDNTIPEGFKMTELGLIPKDWEVLNLGDVAKISSGGSAPQGNHYFNGNHPFIRVQHIDNEDYVIRKYDLITNDAINDYSLSLYPKGTIVFPKSGASVYLEKRAILPTDAYIVSHLCAVISNEESILQHFLFYVLISLKLAKKKASGYPTLNLSEVKQTKIPLPPIPEQKKIAGVLRELQEAKEKTEEVIKAAKELKKSLMKHLFTYGPVSIEEAEEVKLNETEIGFFPRYWKLIRLIEEIDKPQYGYTASTAQQEVGPKFLRITDIQDDKVDWENVPFCKCSKKNYEKYALKKRDIVFARIGATTGKTYIVKSDMKAVFASYLIRIKTKQELDAYYLSHFTKTTIYWKQIQRYKGGKLKQGINIPILSNAFLPLPPLNIQQKISEIIMAVDKKIEAEENKKKALEEVFKTLLNNLMTGKIRVHNLDIEV